MKIGLLTLPLHTNYGGILQAYALQTTLERLGHDVKIINRVYTPACYLPNWKKPLVYSKRFLMKILKKPTKPIFFEQQKKREYPIISQNMRDFIEKYAHVYTVDSLADVRRDDFDAFIVGSDQIWRPKYVRQLWKEDIDKVFLSFTEGWSVKRIAYAVSFGVDQWEYTETESKECSKYLRMFDAVSVREREGVKMCSSFLNASAELVLDPTMLLDVADYKALISTTSSASHKEGTLLVYILDETASKRGLIEKIARERHLKPYYLLGSNNYQASLEDRVLPSVETWLKGFSDAQFVVTDSFHGCVFSLMFGKPFVAIGNVMRGISRFSSLFSEFAIEGHMLYNPGDYDSARSYAIEDSFSVLLEEKRKKSIDFLVEHLR